VHQHRNNHKQKLAAMKRNVAWHLHIGEKQTTNNQPPTIQIGKKIHGLLLVVGPFLI